MWTKNWHRFVQGIYGACKRVENSTPYNFLHSDEGSGTHPRIRAYEHGTLYWIDVFTNSSNYQQEKLDTPPKFLVENSQLSIPSITYATSNISAYGTYYDTEYRMCQLGNGQNSDDYTAYNLASPILSGFSVQNITTGSVFDTQENKHKKTLSISIVNSSSDDITVSEFGLFLACCGATWAGLTLSPALVYYEKFNPVVISPGSIFRITIEQEMPVLEVDTQ